MSTTDTIRVAFDIWWNDDKLTQTNPFREDSPAYWSWEGWQAATEAAKATGTAGELPPLPAPKNISANGSSFSSDQMREYALAAIAASQQAALPVKRYDMTTEYNRFACEDQVTAVENADGAWVKYEDHLAATNRSQP